MHGKVTETEIKIVNLERKCITFKVFITKSMRAEKTDVLIIGAGPSGCVAAAYLEQKGIDCRIVEKSVFPRFVIGESLLPKSMEHFDEVGLLECIKARNYQTKQGARFFKEDRFCSFDFSDKHGEGWDWTWQVPRADFDNTLAQEIIKRGVPIHFNCEVTYVTIAADGGSITTLKDENGELFTIESQFIIDASGNAGVLPSILGLGKPTQMPENASVFAHTSDSKRPRGGEGGLITFDVIAEEVWMWIIPFSNGNTSVGVVGPKDFINSFKGSEKERFWKLMELSKHFKNRFKEEEFLFEPKTVQNFSKDTTKLFGTGFALTGNSAGFLDPVFSSGVALATESGLLAAKLFCKEKNGEKVDWEKDYTTYLKRGAAVFETYIKEWYNGDLQKILFFENINPNIKRQICSVLAGYVWDESNPFVKNHNRLIKTLVKIIEMEKEKTISMLSDS